jgi:RecA/RadA recombinase
VDYFNRQKKDGQMTKVINFFGEPGSGKTTTALGLSYFAKLEGFNVEYVSEVARELAYTGRIETVRQYDIMIAQYQRVAALNKKVDFIITDSPLMLSYVYTYDVNVRTITIDRANEFDNVNFLLCREHEYFLDKGRVHDERQAEFIRDRIDDMFLIEKIPYIKLRSRGVREAWFYHILSKMSEQSLQ